jgi:hypothetical protein
MAPRPRRIVPPPQAEPSVPILPIGSVPVQRPHARANMEETEYFPLSDVSGSDNDDDLPARRHHSRTRDTSTAAAQGEDSHINNPEISILPKTAAADTRYFFEKSAAGDKVVCKECT